DEQPARVDFAEEEKELGIEHMDALEAEAGVVEQLGIGQLRESRHVKTGTTHFFGGRKRPQRARERGRSAARARAWLSLAGGARRARERPLRRAPAKRGRRHARVRQELRAEFFRDLSAPALTMDHISSHARR